MQDFHSLADPQRRPPARPTEAEAEERHTAMLNAVAQFAKPVQQGMVDLKIERAVERKTRVLLMLLPEWAPYFPPYNLAKIASVTRQAGYLCKAIDVNVRAHKAFRRNRWPIDFNPWDPLRDWQWLSVSRGGGYERDLHPHLLPVLEQVLQEACEFKPDVVGFSLYYCNEQPTLWMAEQIKRKLPQCKIVVGGSNTHMSHYKPFPGIDYVVSGEGEAPFLDILQALEIGEEPSHEGPQRGGVPIFRQPEDRRLNLSGLPMPDYDDFDFNDYAFPNGVNSELSRGCIAKCAFCEETHFWKYRQRTAVSALAEIERLYYERSTNVIWFIDSLVNGNLGELRAFAKGVIAKKLKINWTGYARCDGRMDLDYYRDLAASGCRMLNYGCESGSQKVLDLMDKRVTVAEMESNIRDGHSVGIGAMTNWIVGFPNEDGESFEDTMTFLWRMRNCITNIACGAGFNVGVDTIVGQNLDRFGLADFYYLDHWIKKDYTASKVHKAIKNKLFSIFTDFIVTEGPCQKPTRPGLREKHYKVRLHNPDRLNEISYDHQGFDYNIIQPGISPFADSLVNVVWPFLRILWRTRGGYEFRLNFDEALDLAEFGQRGSAPFNAVYLFKINDQGEWHAKFQFEYRQADYRGWQDRTFTDENGISHTAIDAFGPIWHVVDFSVGSSNSVARARKLAWAKTDKKDKDPWNAHDPNEFLDKQRRFLEVRDLNFSFRHKWEGSGKWDR